jgi:hypothetical protein
LCNVLHAEQQFSCTGDQVQVDVVDDIGGNCTVLLVTSPSTVRAWAAVLEALAMLIADLNWPHSLMARGCKSIFVQVSS